MELFALSYGNVLCIYPRLSSGWFHLKTQNRLDKPARFIHTLLFSYVSETAFAWKPAFEIHVNRLMAQDDSAGVHVISECCG